MGVQGDLGDHPVHAGLCGQGFGTLVSAASVVGAEGGVSGGTLRDFVCSRQVGVGEQQVMGLSCHLEIMARASHMDMVHWASVGVIFTLAAGVGMLDNAYSIDSMYSAGCEANDKHGLFR